MMADIRRSLEKPNPSFAMATASSRSWPC